LEPSEAAAAGRGFSNKEGLLGTGLRLEGEKYFVLQADDERLMGKRGSTGFFIYKTSQGNVLYAFLSKFLWYLHIFTPVLCGRSASIRNN
jgi:hypothetical protein